MLPVQYGEYVACRLQLGYKSHLCQKSLLTREAGCFAHYRTAVEPLRHDG
jgi:hypothetical protein